MALRVLVGLACAAVIVVAGIWLEDRFGFVAQATAPAARSLTAEERVACRRLEREWQGFAKDDRYQSRSDRLRQQIEAECI